MTAKKFSFKKGFVHTVTIFFLVLTFASWGVADYVRDVNSSATIAKVGDMVITDQMVNTALERFRAFARQERPEATEEELLNPTLVREQVNQMVREALITQYIARHHLYPSTDQVARAIAEQTEFHENGVFSPEKYFALLKQTRQSVQGFESNIKLSMARERLLQSYVESEIITAKSAGAFRTAAIESRVVSPHAFVAESVRDQIKITDEQAKAYFDKNKSDFDVPERVQVAYVEYSPATLVKTIETPSEENLRDYFDTLKKNGELSLDERRDVRHLLIRFGDNKKAARSKIEELAKRISANPKSFPDLAKEFSEDPGSKAQGGLITNVVRGQMVEAFDQASFSLPIGQVSEVVETPFGYHLLRVEKATAAGGRSFEEVRQDIQKRYTLAEAEKKYAAFTEEFNETVEGLKTTPDAIKNLAEKYGLPTGKSPWLAVNDSVNDQVTPFNLPSVHQGALKTSEGELSSISVRREKRIIVMARIAHEPRKERAFDEAKADVTARLINTETTDLLKKTAQEHLAKLQSGAMKTEELLWERPINLNRLVFRDNPTLLEAAFSQPSTPLPGYFVTDDNAKKVTLYRLDKVFQDKEIDDNMGNQMTETYGRYWSQSLNQMLLSAMMEEIPVKIYKDNLAILLQPKAP